MVKVKFVSLDNLKSLNGSNGMLLPKSTKAG